MEDILAKLGFGEVDPTTHQLIAGTEKFDIYDPTDLDENYPSLETLFEDDPATQKPRLFNYDIIFINCDDSPNSYLLPQDPETTTLIRDYVNQGGRLYVTDLSYDYIEHAFPEYIDFLHSDDSEENEPELINIAEYGFWGITPDAQIHNDQLTAWLANVTCEGGSCLNDDDTVTIKGFLRYWALMNGAEPSMTDEVTTWVSGPVVWADIFADTFEQEGIKPLTVTFDFGQGRVLYTSYHTEDEDPVAGFWPQERILQYLIFEM